MCNYIQSHIEDKTITSSSVDVDISLKLANDCSSLDSTTEDKCSSVNSSHQHIEENVGISCIAVNIDSLELAKNGNLCHGGNLHHSPKEGGVVAPSSIDSMCDHLHSRTAGNIISSSCFGVRDNSLELSKEDKSHGSIQESNMNAHSNIEDVHVDLESPKEDSINQGSSMSIDGTPVAVKTSILETRSERRRLRNIYIF